jgi:hypothetical protein
LDSPFTDDSTGFEKEYPLSGFVLSRILTAMVRFVSLFLQMTVMARECSQDDSNVAS